MEFVELLYKSNITLEVVLLYWISLLVWWSSTTASHQWQYLVQQHDLKCGIVFLFNCRWVEVISHVQNKWVLWRLKIRKVVSDLLMKSFRVECEELFASSGDVSDCSQLNITPLKFHLQACMRTCDGSNICEALQWLSFSHCRARVWFVQSRLL